MGERLTRNVTIALDADELRRADVHAKRMGRKRTHAVLEAYRRGIDVLDSEARETAEALRAARQRKAAS